MIAWLVGGLLATPLVGAVGLATPSLVGAPVREVTVGRLASGLLALHLGLAIAVAAAVAVTGPATVDLGRWYGDASYALDVDFRLDATSTVAVLANALVALVVLRFSERYLHREPGHLRYFVTALVALTCFDVIATAASLDLLFAGWELAGLCSFVLMAYFHEREETVARALRAVFSYRVADLGLLFTLVLLHGAHRSTALGAGPVATGGLATATGLLLLATAAGKSGLGPFSAWLSRSMEGPTPSTALFYAGLSVHAGPYLLLRAWPLYEASTVARGALVAFGLTAAVGAAAHARARSDVKGAIVMSGAAQLGLIVAEIGLGLHLLAGLHMLGNLGRRVWQVLRAPSVLHVAHRREALIGRALPAPRPIAPGLWRWLRVGWVEPAVDRAVAAVLTASGALDRVSRAAERAIGGGR